MGGVPSQGAGMGMGVGVGTEMGMDWRGGLDIQMDGANAFGPSEWDQAFMDVSGGGGGGGRGGEGASGDEGDFDFAMFVNQMGGGELGLGEQ